MTIPVKSYQWPEFVTVQVKDENGDLVECNHAGAEIEEMDGENLTICNKCEFYFNELDNRWMEQ